MRGAEQLEVLKLSFICKMCKQKIEHFTRIKRNKKEYCDECMRIRKKKYYAPHG